MRRLHWRALFVSAAVAGLGLRVWIHRSALGMPDSDEAVVGLMARHVLHGELPTFYWGQAYGGTQEVLLAAPLLAAAGASIVALRVVPLVLSAAAAVFVWRVGRRTLGEPAAAVAGALVWLWPPYPIVRTTPEFGFYASNLFYCALLLLLALRVVEAPSRLRIATFGFVLGLAFWQTAQIIPIAVPLIGWMIWKRHGSLGDLWPAMAAATVGALPWILWNADHGFASVMRRSIPGEYLHGVRLLASPLVPMLLGLRAPLTGRLLVPKPAMYLAYVTLLVLFTYGAVVTRRAPSSLLYVVTAGFLAIWPISRRVTVLTSHPVYLTVLAPVIALLVAQLATTYRRALATLALACGITVVTLHRMDVWLRADRPHWPPTTPRDLGPLVSELDRLRLDRVYANYWIAYRVTFATDERIVATQYPYTDLVVVAGQLVPSPNPPARYPPYQREVEVARHGFVFFRSDELTPAAVTMLRTHDYRRRLVGPFVIYAPPGP